MFFCKSDFFCRPYIAFGYFSKGAGGGRDVPGKKMKKLLDIISSMTYYVLSNTKYIKWLWNESGFPEKCDAEKKRR